MRRETVLMSGREPVDRALARHSWPDGSTFDLIVDPDRSTEAVGDPAGPAEARRP